jgi:AsmA protein
LPAQGPLDLRGDGKVGNQVVRVTAKADSFAQIAAGRATPVEANIELPGLLKTPMALTANVKSANQVVSIDGIRGNTGPGRLTGSVSIDTSGARPRATANLVADRIELVPVESRPASRNEPWSDQPFDFAALRVFEANINVSARELVFRNIRLASADIACQLSGGLMSLQLSRAEFYGGPVQGKIVIDAASRTPRYGASLDFSRVNALPLLTDAADFSHLEGRLQAKLDVTAEGPSPAAVVSSLGGTAQFSLEDGAVRDANLPGMIRALSNQTLQGWQEKGRESTELTNLVAAFRIADGKAITDDLRMAGPLIRVTGTGSANLVARTLDFRVEPKLVLSLQGQGGPSDPAGLGVPVMVRGTFSDPQIYPDVAGILDNPDAAFARLKTMGGALFGLLGGGQQPGQPSDNRKKVDEVVKSLDQMIRGGGDGRGRQPSADTKNQVRDVIRDLLGR